YPDGMVVVGDRVEVLERVHELLDQIEATKGVTWVVQVLVISMGKTTERRLGLDRAPTFNLSAAFASASGGVGGSTMSAAAALNALVEASFYDADVSVDADPVLLCTDGSEVTFVRGRTVPI